MKRIFAIFWLMVLGACVSVYAQRTRYFCEKFNLGEDGTAALAENWDVDSSKTMLNYLYLNRGAEAGGETPEAIIGYYPDFGLVDMLKGTFRLVSKPYTTQAGAAYVTLKYCYVANKVSAADSRGLSILARKDAGEWVSCASVEEFPTAIPASVLCARLPETFENAENVQIAVEVVSSRDGVRFIFFLDDVNFFSMSSDLQAARLETLTSPNVIGTLDTVRMKLINTGNIMENACKVSYRWNGGEVYTKSYDLAGPVGIDESVELKLVPEGWNDAEFGPCALEAWVSEIDGTAITEATRTTTTFYHINEADMFAKKLLVEEFTSATCSPCASMNRILNPAFDTLGLDIVLIKYQMNWPGSGDKYYTADGGARRAYYGVNSVPCLVVEGQQVDPESTTERFIASMRARMAKAGKTLAEILIDTVSMDSVAKILTVSYRVKTVGVLTGVKLQTVVLERETTGNKGSNGEKSFHHVMMAMAPGVGADGNTGLTVDLKADTVYTFRYRIDMGKTNMEEPGDLMLACFIQNDDQSVVQAAIRALKPEDDNPPVQPANENRADYTPLSIYPNPASEQAFLLGLQNATVEVYDMTGHRYFIRTGVNGDYTLDVTDYTPGLYVVRVYEGQKVSTGRLQVVR